MTALTPTVSIIVPVYNGAETISACLESLLNQNYPAEAYEIIVVENGSTDRTTQIVQKYPVRLCHSDRRGPSPARNLGLAKSEAEIIAFTDADCIADPNWLLELVKPYTEAEVGGVGGSILAYTHATQNVIERFSDEYAPLVNFVSGDDEFLPHLYTANASFRRCHLNEIGGFNINLVTAEDVDLAWRLQLLTGTKVCYAPRAIIYHHHRATMAGLIRQYRQYGFGEILLDTMYRHYPGYPRDLRYQARRMLSQIAALPFYVLSAALRRLRLAMGRATLYDAAVPLIWFLIESSNLRGKLEALVATRLMTDAQPALNLETEMLIRRFYHSRKA